MFAQYADLGLWWTFLLVAFVGGGVVIAGSALFFLTRCLFRFGSQRLPFAWVGGFACLVGGVTAYLVGNWGISAGVYALGAYLLGRYCAAHRTSSTSR